MPPLHHMKFISFLSLLIMCGGFAQQSKKVIQIDISSLLNARPVTTLTQGKLITWTKGIDGDGLADGYLTQSAASLNGDKDAHALPDKALISANTQHPEILLHYNNSDDKHNQARFVSGPGEFVINIPANHYSQIFLGLSSAEGPSHLQCELIYSDGNDVKNYSLPDYYNNIRANDSNFTYVLTDLAKWGENNNMTEKDHHNIHLLILSIEPGRTLTGIKVKKAKEGYLVFWSATGISNSVKIKI